ncbi:hypothetical protein GCM10007854_23980 [Algimonas porphyrae]|uniref:Uncharacterized protein n=1 Tax=Algimonas porphyrae TaxID=1128113 RepID=A0ABQ5V3M1_9PROT|nr:hypothetical protein GCM10007854_23980 [Algimonas porphyrae]
MEIAAKRVEFTFRPITPALSEEVIVIVSILEADSDHSPDSGFSGTDDRAKQTGLTKRVTVCGPSGSCPEVA